MKVNPLDLGNPLPGPASRTIILNTLNKAGTMQNIKLLLAVLLMVLSCAPVFVAQQNKQTQSMSGQYALEVSYARGAPFVYQLIGTSTWYAGFQTISGLKYPAGVRPVEAIKLYTREEGGTLKVKVTILRGQNLEFEEPVSEYTVGSEKVVVDDLSRFGVVPFELSLARAPSTVAYLPKINNSTKSLIVSVEPVVSSLPSYRIRVLSSSAKPVAGFAYNTWLEGRRRFSGMPQQFDGTPLIAVGGSYEKVFPYALKTTTQSTGEVPPPIDGLQLNVTAVIFADGTYEGDRTDAVRFRAYKLGEKIQLSRILELFRSKSASSWDTLAPKVDELNYKITATDMASLITEFPGLNDGEVELLRGGAEVSASRIQKDLVGTFGTRKRMDSAVFAAAVSGAIAKCQKWLDSLP